MTKRRDFIRESAMGSAGIAIGSMGFSAKSYASIIGANERIIAAVIGIGGRGGAHIGAWCTLKDSRNVTLKTLCDVDELSFAQRIKTVESMTKSGREDWCDYVARFYNPQIGSWNIPIINYYSVRLYHPLDTTHHHLPRQ